MPKRSSMQFKFSDCQWIRMIRMKVYFMKIASYKNSNIIEVQNFLYCSCHVGEELSLMR